LVGPTAVGKTEVAHVLAEEMDLPILSIDSMMVYRGMDVGTAKPSAVERSRYRYLGLDLADPGRAFSVADYLAAVARQISEAGVRRVIVCGGTGLYLKALLRGIDTGPAPDSALRAELESLFHAGGLDALTARLGQHGGGHDLPVGDRQNPRRVMRAIERTLAGARRGEAWPEAPRPVLAGLRMPRAVLVERIHRRAQSMFEQGLLEETVALDRSGLLAGTSVQAIGYSEALQVLRGTLGKEAAIEATAIRTRQYARRQDTWFRRQENVTWVDRVDADQPVELARRVRAIWEEHGATPLLLPAFDTPTSPG
jgi:tRNA dimethylallyltransferase